MLEHTELAFELIPYFDPVRNWALVFSEIGYNFMPRVIPSSVVAIITFIIYLLAQVKLFQRSILLVLILNSYLFFWLIVPAGSFDMARFLAPFYPLILISFIWLLRSVTEKMHPYYFNVISVYLILFSVIRLAINFQLWLNYQ